MKALSKRDERELLLLQKALGTHLQKLRLLTGRTQAEMDQKPYPMDGKNYQKYELGTRSPSFQTLYVLAKKLEVPIAELFNFEEAKNLPK